MLMRHDENPVLIAEAGSKEAAFLEGLLRRWGRGVRMAASANEVLRIVRQEVIQQGIVATELTTAGEMILARLALLPSMKRLVAVGPGGRPDIERQARLAGANVFLPRPVAAEKLAWALDMSILPPMEIIRKP